MLHSSLAITHPKLTCSSPSTSTSNSHRSFFSPTRCLGLSRFKIFSKIDDGSAEQFLKNNSIADFMRFKRDNHAQLQTAVVRYRKKFPWSLLQPFLQVDLVSTIHIADKDSALSLPRQKCLKIIISGKESCNPTSIFNYVFNDIGNRMKVEVGIVGDGICISSVYFDSRANAFVCFAQVARVGRYFTTLQKVLEPYDCVLYEMVASRETLESRRNPEAKKKLRGSNVRGFNLLGCIQRQMAKLLMLDFQLDCLDYQGDNWYHADLDFETFKLLQHEKGESFFTFARDMTLRSTKAIVQPSPIREDLGPWRSKLLWASRVVPMPLVGLLIIGGVCADVGSQDEYPELEALSRLDFGAALKVFLAKRLTSEFTQVTADVEEKSVIIGERNKAALAALRESINGGNNKIAILYGGGHMPDLGRRLREEFDLIPSEVQWVTAWSIRDKNLTISSLPFLRKLAGVFGWPLNRYQTLALLILSSVLALDLWFWEVFFRTTVNWVSNVALDLIHYLDSSHGMSF